MTKISHWWQEDLLSFSRTGRETNHQDPSSQSPPPLVLFLPVWWIKVSHTDISTCVYSPGINPCKWFPLKTFSPLVISALLFPHLTDCNHHSFLADFLENFKVSLPLGLCIWGSPALHALPLVTLPLSHPLKRSLPNSLLITYIPPPQSARLLSTMISTANY